MRSPCFYGIDMPTRAELVASDLRTDEVASYIGADSLGYLSVTAVLQIAGARRPRGGPGTLRGPVCAACFTGYYPIPVQAHRKSKGLLEASPHG